MDPKILERMGFKPSTHNEIFLDHLECISDFLRNQCPIEKKRAISMLRGTVGISTRYIKEDIDALMAWDIIRLHAGKYEWIFDKVQKQESGTMKYEPEKEDNNDKPLEKTTKPCKHRNDQKNTCMYAGTARILKMGVCERCSAWEK